MLQVYSYVDINHFGLKMEATYIQLNSNSCWLIIEAPQIDKQIKKYHHTSWITVWNVIGYPHQM